MFGNFAAHRRALAIDFDRYARNAKRINRLSKQVSSVDLSLCTLEVISIYMALTWRVCRNITAGGADFKGITADDVQYPSNRHPHRPHLCTVCMQLRQEHEKDKSSLHAGRFEFVYPGSNKHSLCANLACVQKYPGRRS